MTKEALDWVDLPQYRFDPDPHPCLKYLAIMAEFHEHIVIAESEIMHR